MIQKIHYFPSSGCRGIINYLNARNRIGRRQWTCCRMSVIVGALQCIPIYSGENNSIIFFNLVLSFIEISQNSMALQLN